MGLAGHDWKRQREKGRTDIPRLPAPQEDRRGRGRGRRREGREAHHDRGRRGRDPDLRQAGGQPKNVCELFS